MNESAPDFQLPASSAKPGLLARMASASGIAAETDSWFWRRWNIYGTEAACFLLLAYITLNHTANVKSVLGQLLGSGSATADDSAVTEQVIWWAFGIWLTALLVHVFGPSAEKILLALAQLLAARFGVKLPDGTTSMVATTTTSTVAATASPSSSS